MKSQSTDATLLERYQVGIYDVSILSATDPNALINWLNKNNYSISSNARDVIQYYIDKNWYFIAIRINLAPYNEKLVSTLKNIDGRITDLSSAAQYLTDDLVNYVKDEKLYYELTAVASTNIVYGNETQTKIYSYPYGYYGETPTKLIEESQYTQLYEDYNGYLDDHLRSEMDMSISSELGKRVNIPYADDCYEGRHYGDYNYSYCYIWYFTQSSEEYKLLNDVNCGQYCSRVSSTKDVYSADDLAYVAANAIMNGDEIIKSHFGITKTSTEWYQNYDQQFNYVYGQVRNTLINKLSSDADVLRRQLENQISQEYSQKTGMSFGSIGNIAYFFADKTLQDIKDDKDFLNSYIQSYGLLEAGQYNSYAILHKGTHNEASLRSSMENRVKQVVYFENQQVAGQLKSGTIQPLMITFESHDIVYPLKMTSINKGAADILLYVFAKYKTEINGFTTEYAKWINPEDVKTKDYTEYTRLYGNKPLAEVPQYYRSNVYYYTNQLLDDRYFLTKMNSSMYPSEMEDLVIPQAKNNDEYRLTIYEDGYATKWLGFILGIGIMALLLTGIFLPIGWLNNRILKENKSSVYYVDKKRCLYYASSVVIIFTLLIVFYNSVNLYDILSPIGKLFEFIGNVLNLIGLPGILIALIIFALILFLLFEIMNAVGVIIISLVKRMRNIKSENPQPAKV
jgi:hypothetical protein